MSEEAAYVRALELFVDEDFEAAKTEFNQAIREAPTVAKYYLNRAANHFKLKSYIDVITDAEKCLELDPGNSLAFFRKGLAYFSLNEFESALPAFEEAEKLGAKKCDVWIRKCNAEMRSDGKTHEATDKKPTTEAGSKKKETEGKKGAKIDAPPKDDKQDIAASIDSALAPAPKEEPVVIVAKPDVPEVPAVPQFQGLAAKVRENWTQNTTGVQITLFAKNLTDQKVQVEVSARKLSIQLTMPDDTVWSRVWHLWAPVKEAGWKLKTNPFKVELNLEKESPGEWRMLEGAAPTGVVLRENNIPAGPVPPPYSSKKDWNEVEQNVKKAEAEEKPEGEDALQKLFQQIYGDGDPDVRRAMMKSYQTSGGTVLSTNWKEVRDKAYEKEITAPKGQEVRKWGEN